MSYKADYAAPRIMERRDLTATMMPEAKSINLESDAQIKHGVQQLGGYRAPTIIEEQQLDGRLIAFSEVE